LFQNPEVRLIQLNVAAPDARKHGALPLVADAKRGIAALTAATAGWRAPEAWSSRAAELAAAWRVLAEEATRPGNAGLATDAQVLGAVNRCAGPRDVVVGAAGGLPGELHKLWRASGPGAYHLEYGYSCMGYEIAGGLGVKMADNSRQVFVLVGDGSYLMMNSEIATSVMMGLALIIVVLDNRGFGCIDRLQRSLGADGFNNLFDDVAAKGSAPAIDFAAHAASLGAHAEHVDGIGELESALEAAKSRDITSVIVIDTDAAASCGDGGAWWDVAVAEVSDNQDVNAARSAYVKATGRQKVGR
jgi:3D-(3,5/4)-trihydroxycyclohexane-1,2-dione acylhydrolase (decyclizing)